MPKSSNYSCILNLREPDSICTKSFIHSYSPDPFTQTALSLRKVMHSFSPKPRTANLLASFLCTREAAHRTKGVVHRSIHPPSLASLAHIATRKCSQAHATLIYTRARVRVGLPNVGKSSLFNLLTEQVRGSRGDVCVCMCVCARARVCVCARAFVHTPTCICF